MSPAGIPWASAADIAAAVARGPASATVVIETALAAIARHNPAVNAFTDVMAERARTTAARLDAALAAGEPPGPLAGVPFAVKNLYDVAGLPTRAGSRINRDNQPALVDATLVARLEQAGAILVGALNMNEYAYGFTGENAHDGPSRNPHDRGHMSGGSSGGSGSAAGAGLVPLALGSDTNGSIRVPASFCGLFGLKPTYGRLSRAGTFPFVFSLDHCGALTRSVADLALCYDTMQGPDAQDPACAARPADPVAPVLDDGIGGLRVAVAGDWFRRGASDSAIRAVDAVADELRAYRRVMLPEAERARSAAFVITASEGAALHLHRLRRQPQDFDPAVRDRLIAGALIPAAAVERAQRFRRWFRHAVLDLFETVDAIIAPATPMTAPLIGETSFVLNGEEVPLAPNIGLYTQPISFIGLPVLAVPVDLGERMPIGVQVIAPPWREDVAFRIARRLEASGVAAAPRPIPIR